MNTSKFLFLRKIMSHITRNMPPEVKDLNLNVGVAPKLAARFGHLLVPVRLMAIYCPPVLKLDSEWEPGTSEWLTKTIQVCEWLELLNLEPPSKEILSAKEEATFPSCRTNTATAHHSLLSEPSASSLTHPFSIGHLNCSAVSGERHCSSLSQAMQVVPNEPMMRPGRCQVKFTALLLELYMQWLNWR